MEPFNVQAWSFRGMAGVQANMHLLAGGRPTETDRLLRILHQGGGKALGLTLCQELAKADPRFRVPLWITLTPEEQMVAVDAQCSPRDILGELAGEPRVYIRSSASDEDWASGASGVATSVLSPTEDEGAFYMAMSRVSNLAAPVVMQRPVEGIGVVIDVGWSSLLGRCIVRTLTGRSEEYRGQIRYTSATWDTEGIANVYDPYTLQSLVPTVAGVQLREDAYKIPTREIASALVRGMREMGLNFGAQFEVIVHPDRPQVWHLVQVRPSPDAVRPTRTFHNHDTSICTITPVTSRACDITAELVPVSREHVIRAMTLVGDETVTYAHRLLKILKGKILLWECKPPDDYWVEVLRVLSETRPGQPHKVAGHIALGVPAVNTTHGQIRRDRYTRTQDWRTILERVAVAGVTTDTFHLLHCLAKSRSRIRITSDGLVAKISVPSSAEPRS